MQNGREGAPALTLEEDSHIPHSEVIAQSEEKAMMIEIHGEDQS